MNWKVKTLIITLVIFIISVMAFIIKVQYDANQRLKLIETSVIESKNIGNNIIRSQSNYVTKSDLEQFIEDQNLSLSDIKNDLSKFGADISSANHIIIQTPGYSGSNIPSSNTIPNTSSTEAQKQELLQNPDKYGYLSNAQVLDLTEPFRSGITVPFGKATFSAWNQNPWSLSVLSRNYYSTTVIGKDEEGRSYGYSKFQIEVGGRRYEIPINEAKLVEEYPSKRFYFNPKVYLGLNVGGLILGDKISGEFLPNLGLSIFSYGKTKDIASWNFLTIGLGYEIINKYPALFVSPVQYNIGDNIPLITNLFIGPSFSIDNQTGFGIYFNTSVML